jgi:hypothetical protein
VDPFRFTITLPIEADSLSLLRELSNHVAHLIGLNDAAASRAKEELERVVGERMRLAAGQAPVEVAFERKSGEETVTIEVSAVPGPRELNAASRSGDLDEDEGRVRLRLHWDARGTR